MDFAECWNHVERDCWVFTILYNLVNNNQYCFFHFLELEDYDSQNCEENDCDSGTYQIKFISWQVHHKFLHASGTLDKSYDRMENVILNVIINWTYKSIQSMKQTENQTF